VLYRDGEVKSVESRRLQREATRMTRDKSDSGGGADIPMDASAKIHLLFLFYY